MAFCNNCGSKNDDYADFCGSCGSKIQPILQEKPAKGYDQPTKGYDQPAKSFDQPAKGFQEAAQEYRPISPDYSQPSRGHKQVPQRYQQAPPGYHPGLLTPRTGWLTFVIVLYWIGIVLIGIGGLVLLTIIPPLGVILFALAGLMIWLVRELNKYNNTARIISLVLTILGALTDVSNGDVIGLIFAGLIIYALAFDKATVALFQQPYPSQPGARIPRY